MNAEVVRTEEIEESEVREEKEGNQEEIAKIVKSDQDVKIKKREEVKEEEEGTIATDRSIKIPSHSCIILRDFFNE